MFTGVVVPLMLTISSVTSEDRQYERRFFILKFWKNDKILQFQIARQKTF